VPGTSEGPGIWLELRGGLILSGGALSLAVWDDSKVHDAGFTRC
jgi:hypothetical protein